MVDVSILELIDKISVVHADTMFTRKKSKIQKIPSCVNPFFYKELTQVGRFSNKWTSVVAIHVASWLAWLILCVVHAFTVQYRAF